MSADDSLNDLLSAFDLGPKWARDGGAGDAPAFRPERFEDEGRRDPRDQRGGRRPHGQGRDQRGGQPGRGGNDRRERRDGGHGRQGRDDNSQGGGGPRQQRGGRPAFQEPPDLDAARGTHIRFFPRPEALEGIRQATMARAMTCGLFDIGRILYADPARCMARVSARRDGGCLWKGRFDDSLFLTREEASAHFWSSPARAELFEEEEVEVEPPRGVFQSVAKCGISGEWLGPPNFHTYQQNLRRLHRERFSNMPFDAYAARVRMEKDEASIEEWRAHMTKQKRWRARGAGDDAPWLHSEEDARIVFLRDFLDKAVEMVTEAEIPARPRRGTLSPALDYMLQRAWRGASHHPEHFIPAILKHLESRRMPIFKLGGSLFTGPARPHALPPLDSLAERPRKIVEWIHAQEKATLSALWPALLGAETNNNGETGGNADPAAQAAPAKETAPFTPPEEWAADLHWLLHQGHVLHFPDDRLRAQVKAAPAPAPETTQDGSAPDAEAPAPVEDAEPAVADDAVIEAAPVPASEPPPEVVLAVDPVGESPADVPENPDEVAAEEIAETAPGLAAESTPSAEADPESNEEQTP